MENSLKIYNKSIQNVVELRYLGINATEHGKFGIICPHKSNEVFLKKKYFRQHVLHTKLPINFRKISWESQIITIKSFFCPYTEIFAPALLQRDIYTLNQVTAQHLIGNLMLTHSPSPNPSSSTVRSGFVTSSWVFRLFLFPSFPFRRCRPSHSCRLSLCLAFRFCRSWSFCLLSALVGRVARGSSHPCLSIGSRSSG